MVMIEQKSVNPAVVQSTTVVAGAAVTCFDSHGVFFLLELHRKESSFCGPLISSGCRVQGSACPLPTHAVPMWCTGY